MDNNEWKEGTFNRKIKRRSFLKQLAAASAAATVGIKSGDSLFTTAEASDLNGQVMEREGVYTTCGICANNCAMEVKLEDGIIKTFHGMEEDQSSAGGLCGKGYSAAETLYDPDRVKYPLKRTAARKGKDINPLWERISWDEAYDIMAEKWEETIKNYGPEGIVDLGGGIRQLAAAAKSPNTYVTHHSTCYSTNRGVMYYSLGGIPRPYLEKSKYIVAFGYDYVEKAKNSLARDMIDAKKNGAKIVSFNPILTKGTAKADRWIPIRPGTDLAVLLAMLKIIVEEEIYDQKFVKEYTFGFEKIAEWIKDSEYTPQWAEEKTEVPADTIREVARDFATIKPACIPTWKRSSGGPMRLTGTRFSQVMTILMAITGNIERDGGWMFSRTKLGSGASAEKSPPSPVRRERIDGGEKFPLWFDYIGEGAYQALPHQLEKNDPYPVNFIFNRGKSLFGFMQPHQMGSALADKFMVNVNIYLDEITYFADLVLPETFFLERSGVSTRGVKARFPQVSVIQPVISPLGEAKSMGQIQRELAEKIGLEDYISPPPDRNQLLKPYGISYEELKEVGVYPESGDFKPNPGRFSEDKIKLFLDVFEEHGYEPYPDWDEKLLPPEPEEDEFFFTTEHQSIRRHNKQQNNRWIVNIDGSYTFAYINAEKARELGFSEGEKVLLVSDYGSIEAYLRLQHGIRKDIICVPHGTGHWSEFLTEELAKGGTDGDLMPALSVKELVELNDPFCPSADCDFVVSIQKAD